MRCNQVSIEIERFGKHVPKGYPADVQRIHVYCDDFNSIYAALSKAYAMAINELAEYETIGARTDVYTNEFSKVDYRQMHGAIPMCRNAYEDDVNLQYYDTNLLLCEDYIWVYENMANILEVLRECDDKEQISIRLKDRFGLDDYRVKKLSQIRLDMLTHQDYLNAKEKISTKKEVLSNKESQERYYQIKLNEVQKKIEELEVYFELVKHSEEILGLLTEKENTQDLEEELCEKFNLKVNAVRTFKYFTLKDLSRPEQQKKLERFNKLKELHKYYQNALSGGYEYE